MLTIENEDSFRAALRNEVNLFVGAGFSVLAKDTNGQPLPTGSQLVSEICEEFSERELSTQQLPLVSQIVKSKDKIRFNDFLVRRFKVNDYDERYNCIAKFSIQRIFTTNIDDLIGKIFEKPKNKYLNDLVLQGATFRDETAVEFLPLHGNVTYPDPDFTFTPIEIASAFANNPTQFQYLVSCLSRSPTVFLGYSLQDASALQSLNSSFTDQAPNKARWIQLRKRDAAAEAYFQSLGFHIIIGDTDAVLEYFQQEAEQFTVEEPQTLSSSDFGSGRIPTLQQAAVRPITDFYRGHAPVWHDVLSRRIPTTVKYSRLINHIDAGRHVLLTGIPVSGKSTLLMQAAAYVDTKRVKLFEDVITAEKAQSIIRTSFGKGQVLVFIDNIGDSVDSLDMLTSAPNIQVIGADRSVNIGFGSHRFDVGRFVALDCSDLDQADFSKIFSAIPPAIRLAQMEIPEVDAQYNPSAFEFIERNVQGQKISDRYRDVLARLRQDQVEIHDLFVMICYVFSCHVPVSFDVVSRYCKAQGDYRIVYGLTERLGKLLSEVDTNDAQFIDLDDTQDHFTPRSTLISETVVQMCRNEDFRRVYLQFHANVPRLFIPRYSTFRRYGYRAAFADRVFHDWQEGEKFYLKSYTEDKSYFQKQQLAIFLGARKQYELAFKYIDEALTDSRSRNPNIRHTHARLLFDANIDKAVGDPSLRSHLRKSMEILERCHEYDKRQTNHALRFADQSLKYSSVFPGPEAESYRSKAIKWLNEEIAKMPSLRRARYLLRELDR
ncbi:SIR2 family protein [uncultured Roseibium sp.]|uniref:SIR2 family protein n=1 Tax=uncultured Roseibium sp. TaxID=1936171 RepID=UPI00259A3CD9|nr:SIR2 family protein [uncultured Roseibium sp.]